MSGERVLIVEDDQATSSAMRAVFARRGWEVDEVMTVAEGIASLDSQPDWVILDLLLPDGCGEAVLQQARRRSRPVRVAVCTGVDEPVRIANLVALGPDIILRKPIDVFALLGACETVSSR